MSQMTFVPYQPVHRQGCLELFYSNQGKYLGAEEVDDFTRYLDVFADISHFHVLVEDEQVIGCGGVSVHNDCSHLCWGLIKRDRHKQGLGKKLLEFRLNLMQKLALPYPLRLETSQHTMGFFAKYGFEVTAHHKDGFAIGIDNVQMALHKP